MNRLRYGALAIALVGAAACGLGDPGNPSSGDVPAPTPSAGTSSGGTPTPADCIPPSCQEFPLSETPHVSRLTNDQWELTVRDLLKLDVAPGNSVTFPQDPTGAAERFGIDATTLQVTSQAWLSYQNASEELADLIVGDPARVEKLLPDAAKTGDTAARMTAFVTDFLPRAYRRPVTDKEVTDLVATANTSASLALSGDPFLLRLRWSLAATLQNSEFLYRVYLGEDKVENKRSRLTAYELATKLAYGIWNTMPDETLTARAKNGELATKEGVAKVAQSMLEDPRAGTALVRFHELLYLTDNYAADLKDKRSADLFPQFYPEFAADARQDIQRSVNEIVVNKNGGYRDLATSTVAFVNTRFAPIYGIDPTTNETLKNAPGPDTWAQVQMDPAQRKGIMLHPGWLADEGTGKDPSIIHRGVYLARHVTCQTLGSPPAAAVGADPAKAAGKTNRERVIATTSPCGDGCHAGKGGIINALGFGLEAFDSIGMVRATDYGQPLDLAASNDLLGNFVGGSDMFTKLGENARAHACYVAHWSSFLNSNASVDVTPKWLSPAVAKSLANGSVRDIIVELVQTDAFLTVSR